MNVKARLVPEQTGCDDPFHASGPATAQYEVSILGVSKRFGLIKAVDNIDLEIRRGEFFTILGPSGSGKSTLLQILGGFERPTTGRILFRGRDMTDVPAQRRPSATVFQDQALFPHMTVAENVGYGLRVRRIDDDARQLRVSAMLRLVGLEGFERRDVNKLSGGQRQRVALARALVVEPSVLLLDEPLTGLDDQLRQAMQRELKRIHERLGTSFVSVTHNQDEALSMSDRIAVMRHGRLEQVGSPETVYETPATRFVAGFVGSANVLRASPAIGDPSAAEIGGLVFPLRDVPRSMLEAFRYVAIRPERVRVGDAARGLETMCRLPLRERAYKGAVVECVLALPDGQRLLGHAAPNEPHLGPGDMVAVGWRIMDLFPVRDPGTDDPGGDEPRRQDLSNSGGKP